MEIVQRGGRCDRLQGCISNVTVMPSITGRWRNTCLGHGIRMNGVYRPTNERRRDNARLRIASYGDTLRAMDAS